MAKKSVMDVGSSTHSERLLTRQQLAAELQVTTRCIDRWVRIGYLPPNCKVSIGRLVRFREEVIATWLASRSTRVTGG